MYLTCAEIDLRQRSALSLVASPYRTHAVVEASFLETSPHQDETCRILWRLDDTSDPQRVRLYIVSPDAPDQEELSRRIGEEATVSVASKDYLPFVQRVSRGSIWRFRLKANPVRKVREDKARYSQRNVVGTLQGHVTVAQQTAWLLDRSERHGFAVLDVGGEPDVIVSHRARQSFKRGNGKVTLTTAQYDGLLRVEDAALFCHTLGFGVGRGKGFGCGLMTIVPA